MSTAKSIGVVDYGSGNLRSVTKALNAAGASVKLISTAAELETVDAVVVPGVGSFGACAENLRSTGLWDPLRIWLREGRPYLGICLGYQLLFESAEESPGVQGLSHFTGQVVRFSAPGIKIPHIGWNSLLETRGPLYAGTPDGTYMYFVHSYHPKPEDPSLISARCDYGGEFAASISSGNIHATQFHPEKSQAAGQAVLHNFLSSIP